MTRIFSLLICLGLILSATTLYYLLLPTFTYTECLTWAMLGFVTALVHEKLIQ